MNKFIPALLLTSIVGVSTLSASFQEREVESVTSRISVLNMGPGPEFNLRLMANKLCKPEDQKEEIKLLAAGIKFLMQEKDKMAFQCFQLAAFKFGSPLGYLYAAVYDEVSSERYLYISHEASLQGAISPEIYEANVNFLIANQYLEREQP